MLSSITPRRLSVCFIIFILHNLLPLTDQINSIDSKCSDHSDQPCPADCGETTDVYGCRRCTCGVPFYRPPMRDCPDASRKCPTGCGEQLDRDGCRRCICGVNPFFRAPVANVVCPFGTYC